MSSIQNVSGSGKVIVMDRFRSGRSLSPIRQAEAYWSALRSGQNVPRRSQVDPRGLESILEYAFILERIAPGIARLRLAGQHLAALAGMEARGMPLTSFFTPASRNYVGASLEQVFDKPAVAELTLTGESRPGRRAAEARMILLPLSSDLGDISRALGVLVADGCVDHNPYRFDVTNTKLRDVAGPPAGLFPITEPAQVAVPGFAEPTQAMRTGAPHLRLVKSDD